MATFLGRDRRARRIVGRTARQSVPTIDEMASRARSKIGAAAVAAPRAAFLGRQRQVRLSSTTWSRRPTGLGRRPARSSAQRVEPIGYLQRLPTSVYLRLMKASWSRRTYAE